MHVRQRRIEFGEGKRERIVGFFGRLRSAALEWYCAIADPGPASNM